MFLLLFKLQTRASWDQVLARCVQWQSAVSRLVCFGQACTTSTQHINGIITKDLHASRLKLDHSQTDLLSKVADGAPQTGGWAAGPRGSSWGRGFSPACRTSSTASVEVLSPTCTNHSDGVGCCRFKPREATSLCTHVCALMNGERHQSANKE